jgi:2-oxoisovalerate dehydrogenase E1 component
MNLSDMEPEKRRALHRALLLPRVVEERMLLLLRQGKLSKWFSGIGQEAVAVGAAWALSADDYILPMHRNLGVFTGRDMPLEKLFRQLLGRDGGLTSGRDRSFHFGDLSHHIVGMISHLGAMLPVACGLGLAAQLDETRQIALAFVGDGASSEGDVHEAMNLAAVWKLPVVFLVENNQYGLSTPTRDQYACDALVDRASGYGMAGQAVDGNDVFAVIEAVSAAAARARDGSGPTLLECHTFRMRGHEEASGVDYVPPALFEEWSERDPIARFEASWIETGEVTAEALLAIRQAMSDAIRETADEAMDAPEPSSTVEAELDAVYAPAPKSVPSGKTSTERRYIDAIADGLGVQLAHDPKTIFLGQDIAEYGGVFKATVGLVEAFGRSRIRNTPIIESGAIGTALGLALAGHRPMVEMQFADFIACGFNQIVNNLAKTHYRWGEAVPVVIRAPHGGGVGAGPFHSQSIEAWFTSVPGLKVVAPATPHDAKGLLLAAFADPNPVLFLEHKALYRQVRGPVADGYFTEALGQAHIARPGRDASIITYGVGVHWAMDAAETFAEQGTEVEVVDLRTLMPWDREQVMDSVRRTGRVLVLHEAGLTGGFGAELAATIGHDAFEWLDAPVVRVAGLDTPVPFVGGLEELWSARGRLSSALRRLLNY